MTKAAAIYNFFAGFGLPAYEENSVYDSYETIEFPYITYELTTSSWDDGKSVPISASLWYRSTSLIEINAKAEEISRAVGSGRTLKCDGGYIRVRKSTPFAQTMGIDNDDNLRRKILSFSMVFYTEY